MNDTGHPVCYKALCRSAAQTYNASCPSVSPTSSDCLPGILTQLVELHQQMCPQFGRRQRLATKMTSKTLLRAYLQKPACSNSKWSYGWHMIPYGCWCVFSRLTLVLQVSKQCCSNIMDTVFTNSWVPCYFYFACIVCRWMIVSRFLSFHTFFIAIISRESQLPADSSWQPEYVCTWQQQCSGLIWPTTRASSACCSCTEISLCIVRLRCQD